MKKRGYILLAALFLLPSVLPLLAGCADDTVELRVYSWEEYIDEGGEGALLYDELHLTDEAGAAVPSDLIGDDYKSWYEDAMGTPLSEDGPAILEDFELWYAKTYPDRPRVKVKYSTFGTNEDMYNKIMLGKEYDLLCPSDYMIMKLAAEGRLTPYDEDFFLTEGEGSENNYYAKNVSPYIDGVFANGKVTIKTEDGSEEKAWREYAAGYMWGTTGFVYNPEYVDREELENLGWSAFTNKSYANKITAKDNVRDTYFAALGVTYQEEKHNQISSLSDLEKQYTANELSAEEYNAAVTRIFNATDEETVDAVEPYLMAIKQNIYGFETDTGKTDLASGKIWLNYAWSGDAVYVMSLAEEENDTELDYYVPSAGSNLWFDGWVMTKNVEKRKTKHAAQAFVNFLSMPENAMRNSYYIGYTSAIGGEKMFDYASYLYADDEAEDPVEYDLKYFFGEDLDAVLTADRADTLHGQLFAQYPSTDIIDRCAVMNYFDAATSERINELWAHVKAEKLDAWAITVIVVSAVAIVLGVIFAKFGHKIDFFRRKPKKGYTLVKQQDPIRI